MPAFPSETFISEAVGEVSASDNGDGSVFLKILVIGAILLATGGGAIKWMYPNTIEDVEGQIQAVDELIRENMTLERNILGNSAWSYKRTLFRENEVACRIRNRMSREPDRKDVIAWVSFEMCQMRDVQVNYRTLMELQEDLMTEIDNRKRSLPTGARQY
ncbi:hypothetical protein E1B28_010875 [Marasmius oreades]|uniref:Uncharacterized protein n=1 Tax=Marasmius oreades TaxID=181124 RepID=A0A9P7RSW1_9AGAR|nr:uncharacterized protein E1B28_010875 [Marasmius oreades]KAG7089171.1 hypothetical protein E1B28_010875 [Marasmius oreades]